MSTDEIRDERRYAPAVREWHREHEQLNRDRTAIARYLHGHGWPNWKIAEVVGVHFAQVDRVLAGDL